MSNAFLVAILVPAVAAWAVIEALRRSRFAPLLADRPNERSLHEMPVARVGGIGVMLGALPLAAWFGDETIRVVTACAAMLFAVSLADDRRGLPIEVRLPAHFAAAIVAFLVIAAPSPARPGLGVVEAAIAVVAIAWMTNLFNFMDGSDGLAGGMAAIGFGALALGAATANATPLALACAAIAAASAGFLAHNFPPARVFLGDAGSVPLGFLAGALGLYGALCGAWPLWFPVLVFSPFIVDATLTLLRRLARGERVWIAHRTHLYQRLVLAGLPRRSLALRAYALMAAAAASALAARGAGAQVELGIISAWVVLYLLLVMTIERRVGR